MNASIVLVLAGAASLTVALIASRVLAPFYGPTLFLHLSVALVSLLSLGLGMSLGGRWSDRRAGAGWEGAGVGPGPQAGTALLVAAVWILVLPLLRQPLLAVLEPIGLRPAVALAAIVLIAPALVPLGAVASMMIAYRIAGRQRPGSAAGDTAAAFLLGAALAAPALSLGLIPHLGLSRSTYLMSLAPLAASWLVSRRTPPRGTAVLLVALTAAGLSLASPLLARRATPGTQLLRVEDGPLEELRVLDRDGARYLLSDGTIQAVVATENWASLHRGAAGLELLKRFVPGADTLLLLGLRAGSVAQSFAREGWTVIAVESNPATAAIATRDFALRSAEARVHVADPRAFCRGDSRRYPLVVLDAFGGSAVPSHLVTRECFALLRQRLSPGGVLALSIETQGWNDVMGRSLAATLGSEFPHVLALPTGEPPDALGSMIFLASDRPLELPEDSLPRPSDFLSDPYGHWVVVQMNHAWANQLVPVQRGATVLTDDVNPSDLWGERINHAARLELHRFFGSKGGAW